MKTKLKLNKLFLHLVSAYVKPAAVTIIVLVATGSVYGQKQSSDDLLRAATTAANVNKDYPAAITLARKGLQISPNYADLHLLLGRVYMLTGRSTEARTELIMVLNRQPFQDDALNYLINIEATAANYETAIYYVNQALAVKPGNRELLLKKAAFYEQKKEYGAATSIVAELLKRSPNDDKLISILTDMHLAAGHDYQRRRKYEKAKPEFEAVLRQKPDNVEALTSLANIAVEQNDNSRALDYINSALMYDKQAGERQGRNDLLLKKASLLEADHQYVAAYAIIDGLLAQDGTNQQLQQTSADLHLAAGRQEWKRGSVDSAQRDFVAVLEKKPGDTDALGYLINLESARNHDSLALQYIDKALLSQVNKEPLMIKKAAILDKNNRVDEAYVVARHLYLNYPGDTQIRQMEKDLYFRSRHNCIGLSVNYTTFERTGKEPWQLYSAYYLRQEKFGTFLARVNYADRSYDNGWQLELEGYPIHAKLNYSYFDLAYSPSAVFTKYRIAYSYFAVFPKGWELELGARHQYSDKVYISYASSVGKYVGRFWFNFRAFVTPDSNQLSQSYTLTSRYYLSGRMNYLTVIAGSGVSPDDRTRNFQFADRLKLHSTRLTAGFQQTLWRGNVLNVLGTWNNQEYVAGRRENEYDIYLCFQHWF